jgi:hypothetical protein
MKQCGQYSAMVGRYPTDDGAPPARFICHVDPAVG